MQQQIDELVIELKKTGNNLNDPVAKLMITTLLYQTQKIKDEIVRIPERIIERLCVTFVPKNKISAIPALCLVQPKVKVRRDIVPHTISDGAYFTFKINTKQTLSYYPLFKNLIIPLSKFYILTPKELRSENGSTKIQFGKKGQVWLGLESSAEVETFENVSFLIKGTNGVLPKRIAVNNGNTELSFTSATNSDELSLAEPFDSQQVTADFIEIFNLWRRHINGGDNNSLIFITDKRQDRDVFKCRAYPKVFQQYLESSDLDQFANNILWILFDFGTDFDVPAEIEILPNIVPVTNVNINNVTLTQSSPIAKLTKNDGSFFLSVIETPLSYQRQGFSVNKDEFVIRDFDTCSYNAELLYKDIRNLYNRFIDDYYAFIDYHNLKDGESVRSLRDMINRIGKSVQSNQEIKNRYDEGTYAMRSVNLSSQIASVRVSYLTTFGRLGNTPTAGSLMENKKDAALEKDVRVITTAECGEDKADADQLYEMLRYYTLTSDRLFTKMDIDAFIRLQLLKEFGKEEVQRINYTITVQGAAGPTKLRRGLYIDIQFKDTKNYQKALSIALDRRLKNMIEDKSCLSMPIIITLINLETI